MKRGILIALLGLAPVLTTGAEAQVIEQDYIGPRSPEVIRHELRLDGLDPRSVVIRGDKAHVSVRINGRPAVLEVDQIDGRRRVLYGPRIVWPRVLPNPVIPGVTLPGRSGRQ